MAKVISKEELETPRSAAEMLDWVHAALARFNTRELRAEAREGEHFAKELTDEALPIGLFAKEYFCGSGDVLISHEIGSQQYDATVEDCRENASTIRHIEATVSDRNYTEALRIEILNEKGSVAAYGKVVVDGPKRQRTKLEAESIAVKHDDIHDQHLQAVAEVVAKKARLNYPEHTALVVRVDDAGPFREADDVASLEELAISTLIEKVSGREFDVLALVGSQGLFLCYDVS